MLNKELISLLTNQINMEWYSAYFYLDVYGYYTDKNLNGFGNWFRKQCDAAGLPKCSAHGLRKAGATIAADNGATEFELMAIYGWETPKEAARYTRKANRNRLAARAVHLVAPSEKK